MSVCYNPADQPTDEADMTPEAPITVRRMTRSAARKSQPQTPAGRTAAAAGPDACGDSEEEGTPSFDRVAHRPPSARVTRSAAKALPRTPAQVHTLLLICSRWQLGLNQRLGWRTAHGPPVGANKGHSSPHVWMTMIAARKSMLSSPKFHSMALNPVVVLLSLSFNCLVSLAT